MTALALAVLLLTAPAQPEQAAGAGQAPELRRLATALAEAEKLRCDERWFMANFALARLALKKASLLQAGGAMLAPVPVRIEDIVRHGLAAIERIKRRQLPPIRPGQLNELAYEARSDGSVQPYYLYLPPDYSPDRRWPLIVFLHGYVPTITVLDPWVLPPEQCAIAGRNGCMLLIPYGRRNTDFQGVGEVDVLETTRLVCDAFPVDRDRIYICGVSMGGMGAWNMALRHPGAYAAAAPISGQTDMLTWWGWPRDRVAPFKRWLIEWDNPIDLVENARGQHIFVQHGELDDLIPAEQSRSIVRKALSLGIPIKYYEHKGKGHYIYWENECFERAFRWLPQFKRGAALARITFVTYSLEYDTAFWTRIVAIDAWGKPARIDVRRDAKNSRVEIRAENVASLALDRDAAGLGDATAFVVNGRPLHPARSEGPWLILDLKPPAAASGFPPPKRKGLCGPVEEVFDGPFILVQGTAGDGAADADLAAKVRTWAIEWAAFADGFPRIATDAELTDEQIRRYNLVLFGTPKTNSVLARVAARLPISIGEKTFRIGERAFSGDNLGLVMCYPNPLAPDHYLAVYSGKLYGRRLAINHKHDLLPDFLVFRSDQFDYDDAEMWVCGGFFDSRWRLSPETTWVNPNWRGHK